MSDGVDLRQEAKRLGVPVERVAWSFAYRVLSDGTLEEVEDGRSIVILPCNKKAWIEAQTERRKQMGHDEKTPTPGAEFRAVADELRRLKERACDAIDRLPAGYMYESVAQADAIRLESMAHQFDFHGREVG